MRQSRMFSAAGLGLLAGLLSLLVFRDGQAEQPAAKTAGFAVSVVEQPANEKPATGKSTTQKSATEQSCCCEAARSKPNCTAGRGRENSSGRTGIEFQQPDDRVGQPKCERQRR